MKRLEGNTDRPLLQGKTLEDVQEMMELRDPIYQYASDLIIDTDEKTPDQVAGEIVMSMNLVPTVS